MEREKTNAGDRSVERVMGPKVEVERFEGVWDRTRGLIGRPAPAPGPGVLIRDCRQVHTFFMRYSIDVVHLDRAGMALRVLTLAPWRVGPWIWRSRSVLELSAGEASRLGIVPGVQPALIAPGARVSTRNSRV